jgi:Zn-dependent protease
MSLRPPRLLTFRGVPVLADLSWLAILPLLLWTLAEVVMPWLAPELSGLAYWGMSLAAAGTLIACLLVRETAHILAARHFDVPFSRVRIAVFGGIPDAAAPGRPGREILVSIAALVASLLLAAIFLFLFVRVPGPETPLSLLSVVFLLIGLNCLIGIGNLVPAYPLSGGRLLRAGLARWSANPARATQIAAGIGAAFGLALVAASFWLILSGSTLMAIWALAIGLIVCHAALAARSVPLTPAGSGAP